MKRVTHRELLEYPSGTIYLFLGDIYSPPQWGFNMLCQKGETTGHGHNYKFLMPTLDALSNESPMPYTLDRMEHPSGSGDYYDDTKRFVVYEREDVRTLLYALGRAGDCPARTPGESVSQSPDPVVNEVNGEGQK